MRILINYGFLTGLCVMLCSCVPDYSKELIGKWDIIHSEMEFEGTPTHDYDYTNFNYGIEFREDKSCNGFIPKNKFEKKYFYTGSIFDGKYSLNGNQLTINNRYNFTLISLEKNILKMDLHLTLHDVDPDYAHLNKMKNQGTGENVIYHLKLKRIQE